MTELWPGFAATDYPVAVFDGEDTWLYRHPNPPDEFHARPEKDGALAFAGRHPAVVGSSTVELGGVPTATVLQSDPSDVQAEIAHETFHVFCGLRHPGWAANDASALAYPVENVEALTLRRLEAEALRRALVEGSAGWAAAAVDLRQQRFAQLPASVVQYERDLERLEGLALYVEGKAAGAIRCVEALANPLPPDDVRRAAYQTGEAMAVLLDRLSPGWNATLEADDALELDDLLRAAVSDHAREQFSFEQRAGFEQRARESIEALRIERRSLREAFLARPGRIVLTASGPKSLVVTGYDPMNIRHLGGGEVLHMRFLKLHAEGVDLELYDAQALTESAGAHPLHDGIQRVTFTGIGDAA